MYYCTDCGREFESPKVRYERHKLAEAPFEEYLYCPHCNSDSIKEESLRYCRCCGRKLPDKRKWYCNNDCKLRGEKLWRIERERRRRLQGNTLIRISAKIEKYNKAHGTNYSYGYFVANILPKLPKMEAREYI